jgi:hypothetical protein
LESENTTGVMASFDYTLTNDLLFIKLYRSNAILLCGNIDSTIYTLHIHYSIFNMALYLPTRRTLVSRSTGIFLIDCDSTQPTLSTLSNRVRQK